VLGLTTGPIQFPVHPGLQPGGGGWGILAQLQAYRHIAGPLSAYALGLYQMSPQKTTEVKFTPTSTIFLAVHDVYHARAGVGYAVSSDISASLGVRVDGIPVRDVLGNDRGFRAPGYSAFVDPGISAGRGRTTVTLSVPVRFHGQFKKNIHDLTGGSPPPGDRGDLAKYLIFAGIAHRL
jgi:hypothetical protein